MPLTHLNLLCLYLILILTALVATDPIGTVATAIHETRTHAQDNPVN